jgi:hypothetical protein
MAITTNGGAGVTADAVATLSNKTLEAPVINNATFTGAQSGLEVAFSQYIVFEGTTANAFETTLSAGDPTADRTITLPDSTGTVALTSDLTSYITASSTDTLTNKTLTSPTLTTPTVSTSASFNNEAEVRFLEATANGTNYVGFKAPSTLSANKIWVLPTADGSANQVLTTDGSGNLSFAASSAGVSANDQAFAFAVQVFA